MFRAAEQIKEITLKIVLYEQSCHFEWKQFSYCDPGANWSKLEHM
jgi:hypothetical protein